MDYHYTTLLITRLQDTKEGVECRYTSLRHRNMQNEEKYGSVFDEDWGDDWNVKPETDWPMVFGTVVMVVVCLAIYFATH